MLLQSARGPSLLAVDATASPSLFILQLPYTLTILLLLFGIIIIFILHSLSTSSFLRMRPVEDTFNNTRKEKVYVYTAFLQNSCIILLLLQHHHPVLL